MKRMTTFILALLMTFSLAAPALAEGAEQVPDAADTAGLEAELTELILGVKQALQIGEDYEDFTSNYYDGVTPYWSFGWSSGGDSVNVDVRTDGTVLNAYHWSDSGDSDRFYGFDPAFPALSREEAEAQAEEWFGRLFPGPETARVDSVTTVLGKDGCYRFDGTVEKNGLPSPVTFTLCVDSEGFSNFYRSDSYSGYVGELPAPEASVDEGEAAKSLAEAVELELRYVSDGEGGASLRYVPVGPTVIVDARTGEAVDMDALYDGVGGASDMNGLYAKGVTEEAAADSGAGLTEVELASVESYGNILDQGALDAALRDIAALGLEPFTLQRCSYAMDGENGGVTAIARYAATMTGDVLYGFDGESFAMARDAGADLTIWKYITADAETGALKSVSTTYPFLERDETVSMTPAVRDRAAESFLAQAAPDLAEEAALCELAGYNEDATVTYAQVHEGYFYPENYLSVTVNAGTGTVDEFNYAWEDVTFGPAEDVVTAKEAKDAYTNAMEPVLGYVAWPVDVTMGDGAVYAGLLEMGYTYVEELRLGYYFDGAEKALGVDAITGEAVTVEDAAGNIFTYDDLEQTPEAAEIEALAQAGIGFAGGSFLPEAELTQREAVTLLLQADGETVLPGTEDDDLLERGSWRGFVTAEDWDPDEVVTRMGFIRMVLGASRYGDGARLLNLTADEGYNVMALALGMDTDDPDGPLSRAGAAVILYRFMDR